MAKLSRSNATLELGRRLVAQLDEGDFLGAWMAHHIADLILQAETFSSADQVAAMSVCRAAVLELWERRRSFPRGRRPFDSFDPVLRAIAALDVDGPDYRYYSGALRAGEEADVPEEVAQNLKLASGIDYTARVLIRRFLKAAALKATAEAEPWVQLALDAGADGGVDGALIGFLSDEDLPDLPRRVSDRADQAKRLRAFIALAEVQADELEAQIEPQPGPADEV